jgi:hypothetical protein
MHRMSHRCHIAVASLSHRCHVAVTFFLMDSTKKKWYHKKKNSSVKKFTNLPKYTLHSPITFSITHNSTILKWTGNHQNPMKNDLTSITHKLRTILSVNNRFCIQHLYNILLCYTQVIYTCCIRQMTSHEQVHLAIASKCQS